MKPLETLREAHKLYGGIRAMAATFQITVEDLRRWDEVGIPTCYELGLYHGVIARGREPTPKLFRLKAWGDRRGVAE